jgi:hypothetical protein
LGSGLGVQWWRDLGVGSARLMRESVGRFGEGC